MNLEGDFLKTIVKRKRRRLAEAEATDQLPTLREAAREVRYGFQQHALRRALEGGDDVKIIAEIKRASPSKGLIKERFAPIELARAYEQGGAAAISVLTEEDYFQGSLSDLQAVRQVSRLPILRKDFIIEESQIYETALAGADALLLIVAALSDEQLARFRRITEKDLAMDALVEVHTLDELRRAQHCGATMIGVNNRDLNTFEVSVNVSINLACEASAETLLVSESGLRSPKDLSQLHALGYKGFLIGEALMRAENPAATLRRLTQASTTGPRSKICGITNLKDALACVREGADMLGFNFYRYSPRYITPEQTRKIIEQLPSNVMNVGIFVNEESPARVGFIAERAGVSAIQLHGDETPHYCRALKNRYVIKALRVNEDFRADQLSEYETEAILLDAFSSTSRGGNGERFDWSVAQQAHQFASRLFLAGGITPENVNDAIEVVCPYAVDVCSGVESAPGQKDEGKIRALITAAKKAGQDGHSYQVGSGK